MLFHSLVVLGGCTSVRHYRILGFAVPTLQLTPYRRFRLGSSFYGHWSTHHTVKSGTSDAEAHRAENSVQTTSTKAEAV